LLAIPFQCDHDWLVGISSLAAAVESDDHGAVGSAGRDSQLKLVARLRN
jgi:hypothetical protein